ncbi:biotin/lipoyl-binding protein, partial [Enterococcus faecalis]|nr:biotin/lipoyl-binding protein [Enterococcus faecalis]
MKNYHITVNGKTYDVTVEEVSEKDFQAQPQPEAAAPSSTPTPSSSAGTPVNAPMPGTIIAVNVSAGDAVKAGQVLCV